MREFRIPHLRGEPTVDTVLTNIRTRCNRMPELQAFSLHIVDRLEQLHDEVAKLNPSDPPRCAYVDTIEYLLVLTRRKALLVRLAKCKTIALMFKELHQILDDVESGLDRNVIKTLRLRLSRKYRRLAKKWKIKWASDRVEQESLVTQFAANATDRQLVREMKSEKMVEKVLRELEQAVNGDGGDALLELTKVTFDRVLNFSKQQIQFTDWFISENDLLLDNVPAKVGTFGSVISARWFHDGECTRVVVKQIFPETSNNAEEAFFRELERWNNVVDNEHVLKFYGGSHVSKPRLLVCEYAPRNISDFLNEDNTELFWPMFLQAARGLKALHTQGIVHGNLKCSNIRVADDKTVKLTDFGVDSVRAKAIVPNSNVVTKITAEVRWKPKEMLESSSITDQRFESDIYSLGMCMIEAMEKRYPFGSATNAEVTDFVMHGGKHHRPRMIWESHWDASWNLIELLCDPDYTKRPTLDDVIKMIHNLIQSKTGECVEKLLKSQR
ncbi:Serine/threonine protein kinase [Phytophthora palmivora]|uniref:Serine/threonine protein kinase n=1 Tax=Phytophthora palmivora TaxID=4796 RepID=A0A2P4WZ24_9STRA|nr:Serine/threonine protein kinase [Phytophthora palmivora]